MNFSFLAPLALLGSILLSVPFILHLIDRRRLPRIEFPAMRFLLVAQKRLKRRRRVRDPWLLLVRLLALLALVLAFALPQVKVTALIPAGAELEQNVVFLLDNSMSMQLAPDGESLLEKARQRAREVLERLPEGGRAGLVVFNREAQDLIGGMTPDLQKVEAALADVHPSYEVTDLKTAILVGLRALLSTPEGGGDLYLLSDRAAHALSADSSLNLPTELQGRVRLVVTSLSEEVPGNRSLVGATAAQEEGEGGRSRVTARVKAHGSASGGEVSLELALNGEALTRGFVALEAGGEASKSFTLPRHIDPNGLGVLSMTGDALEADDRTYFRLLSRRDLRVLVVDGQPGEYLTDAESFFVERALNPSRSSGSRVLPEVVGEGALPALDPRRYPVVFLLNVSDPTVLAGPLLRYVRAGGGLFVALGSQSKLELYNRRLTDLLPAALGEVKAASVDLTGEKPPGLSYPEVGHPIFQVFREAGAEVFSTTAFGKVVPTAPTLRADSSVLLKYTNGLPALLARTVGSGRVLLFTSSLDREWNDFPLKSVFLPFIQESTHFLARNPTGEDRSRLFTVGQPVILEQSENRGSLVVVRPDGHERTLEPIAGNSKAERQRLVYRDAGLPGHYRVLERGPQGGTPQERPELGFSVNVAETEGDPAPLEVDLMRARLRGLPVVLEGQTDTQGEVQVERTLALTYPLLWGLLLFLVLEGALALWRQRLQEHAGAWSGSEETKEARASTSALTPEDVSGAA